MRGLPLNKMLDRCCQVVVKILHAFRYIPADLKGCTQPFKFMLIDEWLFDL